MRRPRLFALLLGLFVGSSIPAFAQTPQLIFTAPTPTSEASALRSVPQVSAVIEERGLALWSGSASDFGVGVTLSTPHWTVRSISSMTELPFDGRQRRSFQQLEIAHPVWSRG